MASILILGGVLPLSGAIIAQYGFGYHPCHFCILERWPYVLVILTGVLSLMAERGGLLWRVLVAIGVYALLVTAVLGLVHTGIEDKLLTYTGGCVAQKSADTSIEALRAALETAPIVACDAVTLSFLGLSMATWNSLWAFVVIALIYAQMSFERRRYARLA